jgi:hypothetical protein
MKKIQDIAAYVFMLAVAILSFVSILGIWKIFGTDVIWKSFQTLGLLAVVAVMVMVASKFMESRSQTSVVEPYIPAPAFKGIRKATVVVLIVAASFLAILGVMAIWELVSDKEVLYKALGTLGVLAFGAFIIIITSLEREGNKMMNRGGGGFSVGTILLVLFLVYILFVSIAPFIGHF